MSLDLFLKKSKERNKYVIILNKLKVNALNLTDYTIFLLIVKIDIVIVLLLDLVWLKSNSKKTDASLFNSRKEIDFPCAVK